MALLSMLTYGVLNIVVRYLYLMSFYSQEEIDTFGLKTYDIIMLLNPIFVIDALFIFILCGVFLSQLGRPILSIKNMFFAILLPLIYIISKQVVNFALSLPIFAFAINSVRLNFAIRSMYKFQSHFMVLISLGVFIIFINRLAHYFRPSKTVSPQIDLTDQYHDRTSLFAYALLIGLMVIMTRSVSLNIMPHLLPIYEDDRYFKSLFSILFTIIMLGYFTIWNKNLLFKKGISSLDQLLKIGIKICFISVFFWILWSYLTDFMWSLGNSSFTIDLKAARPVSQISYLTNGGISLIMLILATILSAFIAKKLPSKKQQMFHYSALLLIFSIVLYDAIKWGASFRLILFQCGLFMLSMTVILSILTIIYPFIWNISTRKWSIKRHTNE